MLTRRPTYDVFISYASEDQADVARPLAQALRSSSLRVWYDESIIKIGDNVRKSIEKGLTNSRYGIVILSPAYFRKEWTQKELDGLLALEAAERGKFILPVWHNLQDDEVSRHAPLLASKVAGTTRDGIPALANELLKVIQPPARPPPPGLPSGHTDPDGSEATAPGASAVDDAADEIVTGDPSEVAPPGTKGAAKTPQLRLPRTRALTFLALSLVVMSIGAYKIRSWGASPDEEMPAVRTRLDWAEAALERGTPREAIRVALDTLNAQKTTRAFSIIARAYCRQGDVADAKATLSSVPDNARAARAKVLRDCKSHGLDLE